MAGFFSKIKEKMTGSPGSIEEGEEQDYVELGSEISSKTGAKVLVRPFVITDFESIKPILDSLREGHTIALVNIKPLKDKDLVELKRAINKLKKTCDAIEGDIAGFGDNWIAAVPSFAHIHRQKAKEEQKNAPASSGNVNEVTEYD